MPPNAPRTAARFPRGEAVHYREHALDLGVPDDAILLETETGNTGQNITLSREVLRAAGVEVSSLGIRKSAREISARKARPVAPRPIALERIPPHRRVPLPQ